MQVHIEDLTFQRGLIDNKTDKQEEVRFFNHFNAMDAEEYKDIICLCVNKRVSPCVCLGVYSMRTCVSCPIDSIDNAWSFELSVTADRYHHSSRHYIPSPGHFYLLHKRID